MEHSRLREGSCKIPEGLVRENSANAWGIPPGSSLDNSCRSMVVPPGPKARAASKPVAPTFPGIGKSSRQECGIIWDIAKCGERLAPVIADNAPYLRKSLPLPWILEDCLRRKLVALSLLESIHPNLFMVSMMKSSSFKAKVPMTPAIMKLVYKANARGFQCAA